MHKLDKNSFYIYTLKIYIITIKGGVQNYYNNLEKDEFRTLDAWVEIQHPIH